jgi:segregation and condensation protein B
VRIEMDRTQIKYVVEAALLAAGRPLPLDKIAALFTARASDLENETLVGVLDELATDYQDRGLELKEVSSGYRIQIRSSMTDWLTPLWEERAPRYTRALLETLALIAYRQPITRAEIEEVRGVAVSTNITRTLLERNWIRVVGHRDVPGKPAMFGTTRDFLDYFGLKKLDDLPTLAEIKEGPPEESPQSDLIEAISSLSPQAAARDEVEGGDGIMALAPGIAASAELGIAGLSDADSEAGAASDAAGAAVVVIAHAALASDSDEALDAQVEASVEALSLDAVEAREPAEDEQRGEDDDYGEPDEDEVDEVDEEDDEVDEEDDEVDEEDDEDDDDESDEDDEDDDDESDEDDEDDGLEDDDDLEDEDTEYEDDDRTGDDEGYRDDDRYPNDEQFRDDEGDPDDGQFPGDERDAEDARYPRADDRSRDEAEGHDALAESDDALAQSDDALAESDDDSEEDEAPLQLIRSESH